MKATEQERPLPAEGVTAASLQRIFDSWHDDVFSGADHGCSLLLPDGRSLWLFGDTERGSITADGGRGRDEWFIRSSFLLYGRDRLRLVSGPDGGGVLPDGPERTATWPHGAAVDRGLLHVFATRTRITGSSALDFELQNVVVASYRLPPGRDPVFAGVCSLPDSREKRWGAALTADADYLYVYATVHSLRHWVFGNDVFVARVPYGDLLDFGRWEFWDGGGWSPHAGSARVILGAEGGPGTAMSVFRRSDGAWVLLSKQHDAFGQSVSLWSAPAPQGPWSLDDPAVAAAPSFVEGSRFTYNAFAHPEIVLSNGRLLVTVSRNSTSPPELARDANLYMPQFLELEPTDIGGRLMPTQWQC